MTARNLTASTSPITSVHNGDCGDRCPENRFRDVTPLLLWSADPHWQHVARRRSLRWSPSLVGPPR